MNKIGIIQGRLLPPVNGKLQAFPGKDWKKEFPLAKKCGFDGIELIFDFENIEYNPLNSKKGIKELKQLSERYQIRPLSVCANYFMKKDFTAVTQKDKNENIKMLQRLTDACQEIGAICIDIPLLGEAEIKTEKELYETGDMLIKTLQKTYNSDVIYALETSLQADVISKYLNDVNHPRLKVCYDTGNNIFFGYKVPSEIKRLSYLIASVHIKDSNASGENCLLGTGDANFEVIFGVFAKINYRNHFILETQRGENPVENAKRHLRFVREKILQYYSEKKGIS